MKHFHFNQTSRIQNPKSRIVHPGSRIQDPGSRNSFTLIELLVVMAIISMLAGLLMPALSKAREATKKAKAQTGINSLAIALKAYYTEYGTWPYSGGTYTIPTSVLDATQNKNLYLMLSGSDIDLAGTTGGNSRKIPFSDFKPSELKPVSTTASSGVYPASTGTTTNWVDPWSNSYMVRFDDDGDGTVPVYGSSATIKGSFAIWSAGPDKKVDSTETSATSPTKTDNKDNIYSWK